MVMRCDIKPFSEWPHKERTRELDVRGRASIGAWVFLEELLEESYMRVTVEGVVQVLLSSACIR